MLLGAQCSGLLVLRLDSRRVATTGALVLAGGPLVVLIGVMAADSLVATATVTATAIAIGMALALALAGLGICEPALMALAMDARQ